MKIKEKERFVMFSMKIACTSLIALVGVNVYSSNIDNEVVNQGMKSGHHQRKIHQSSYSQNDIDKFRADFEMHTLKYVESYLLGRDAIVGRQRSLIRASYLLNYEYLEYPYYADVVRVKLKFAIGEDGGYDRAHMREALEGVSVASCIKEHEETFASLVAFVCRKVGILGLTPSTSIEMIEFKKDLIEFVEKYKEYLNVHESVLMEYEKAIEKIRIEKPIDMKALMERYKQSTANEM